MAWTELDGAYGRIVAELQGWEERAQGQGLGHDSLCTVFLAQTKKSEDSKFESGLPGCHEGFCFKAGKQNILYLPVSLMYNFCRGIGAYVCTLAVGPLNVRGEPCHHFSTV